MLPHRDAGQSFVDAGELERRCDLRQGEWLALLRASTRVSTGPRYGTTKASESARAVRAVREPRTGSGTNALANRSAARWCAVKPQAVVQVLEEESKVLIGRPGRPCCGAAPRAVHAVTRRCVSTASDRGTCNSGGLRSGSRSSASISAVPAHADGSRHAG